MWRRGALSPCSRVAAALASASLSSPVGVFISIVVVVTCVVVALVARRCVVVVPVVVACDVRVEPDILLEVDGLVVVAAAVAAASLLLPLFVIVIGGGVPKDWAKYPAL